VVTELLSEGAIAAAKAGRACRALNQLEAFLDVRKISKTGKLGQAITRIADAISDLRQLLKMCFVAGTPVHTPAGLRPIESLQPGDLVLSRPEGAGVAGPVRARRVLRTFETHPTELYNLTCQRADGAQETLGTTAPHPFFVVGRDEFVPAAELQVGDEFLLHDGGRARLIGIRIESAAAGTTFTTYNIEVEEDHTYHVGQLGTWVHNTGAEDCARLAERLTELVNKDLTSDSAKEIAELLKKHPELEEYIPKSVRQKIESQVAALAASPPLSREARNALRSSARDLWQARTGRRAIWDGLDVHHRIPLEWSHLFPDVDPNRISNLIGMTPADHTKVSAAWNFWRQRLDVRVPTRSEVLRQAI